MKKIVILVGNPVKSSFSYACANRYEKIAKENGAEVIRFNIDEMDFDPTLHQGYEKIQELEEDLVKFQDAVTWSEHVVFIYPNWWSSLPVKMKGVFDRSFLSGFAFKFVDGRLKPLLKNKSARIINISGSIHPILLKIAVGNCINAFSKGVLRACGFSPIYIKSFGPTGGDRNKKKRFKWLDKVSRMALKDSR